MKLKAGDVQARLKDVGKNIRVVVLYGPDNGRAIEYSKIISKQIAADLTDPFQVAEPRLIDVKENPSLLLDEINAVPMMGGRKLVRYDFRGTGNEMESGLTTPLRLALEGVQGDGLLVVTLGDVRATAGPVKLAEASDIALAIACYQDEAKDVAGLINETFSAAGITITRDAADYLRTHLGGDRSVTRSELNKLVIYKGNDKSDLTLEDVEALTGDSSSIMIQDIAEAVTAGNINGLEQNLQKAEVAKEAPVAILRVVQTRFQRLYQVQSLIDAGQARDAAIRTLQPPLFWKDKGFQPCLDVWTLNKLSRAVILLYETEVQLKSTGNPAQTILARALLQLANAGKKRR